MLLVKRNCVIKITNTKPAFICPKSTTETPEQGANHAQSRQQRHQHDANGVALLSSQNSIKFLNLPARLLLKVTSMQLMTLLLYDFFGFYWFEPHH